MYYYLKIESGQETFKLKLARLNISIASALFAFACSKNVLEENTDTATRVHEEPVPIIKNEKNKNGFSVGTSNPSIRQKGCSELFKRSFFEENGTVKEFGKDYWKGIFENDTIKIEYWSTACLNKGCKITSKTSCAHSFYNYQNQVLVTFDSVDPKCEKVYFFQLGMPEYSLPFHVKDTL